MTRTSTQGSTKRVLRYWAIRIGDSVEFRSSYSRPVKVVSSFMLKRGRRYNRVVTQTFYVGGKVIGVVDRYKLYDLFLPEDGRLEVSKTDMKRWVKRGL
jgi:hypothetical protein